MKKRMGESGNIFFTLFGAVALVGVVGAATSTLMRGPVGTVVALNQRAKADSQMQIAMKLAMLEAQNNSNDCDNDTFIEPVGAGAAISGLTGGGRLPQVGSTTNDPWGSPYGYCGWNHGTDVTSTCSGGTTPLLRGSATGQGTVIAVLSAGPDRTFGTTCVDNPAPNAPHITKTVLPGNPGNDDLIVSMTYSEANEASGGLWSISSTDPDAITTNRSLDVSTGAQFSSGDVGFTNTRATFGTGSTLDFSGGGLFMLPNECQSASCGNPNKGLMRRFTNATCPAEGTQEVLQICDGAGWLDIGGAGAIVAAAGNPGEIQYNVAGLMGASSSLVFNSNSGITVGGDSIFSADLRVNQTLRTTTLNVTGNTVLTGTLDVDGATDFDSTIDVALGATFGSWLRGSDGTSGAPTYSFSSDTDSGMFFSSSALRFSVDGAERMAVSAGGVTMTAGQSLGNFTVDGTLTTNDLNVNNNITANRFISRMGTTSAALPAFETEPGTGMYSAVDNTLSLVAGGTPRIVIDGTGDVGIGVLSPDAKLDVGGEIKVGTSNLGCGPTLHGAIRYVSGDLLQVCSSVTGIWEDIGTSGGGGGGAASYWTRISSVDRRLYYDDAFVGVGTNNPLDDFHVAGDLLVTGGFTGTPSIGASGAGSRMFYDPESGSFRAGTVAGTQWDSGNMGALSFAVGQNVLASGLNARAMGAELVASGDGSMAIGQYAQATNTGSVAVGLDVISSGVRSTIWGLGDATGASPTISGTESFATIMGDQSGINMTANQTWALLGGRMLIDQTPAVNPAVSGTLSLDVEGGVGAMQYCDENGVNCFTAASVATGGVTAPGNNRELIYNSGGVLGANPAMTFSSAGNLTLGGTGAIALPSGDGTNRPAASTDGMLRYNTALGRFEGYQGGQWRDLITGTALAAGANTQIQFNSGGYFGAVPAFTFAQGELRVDGTDYNRGGVMRIRGNEAVAANYLDATMILESTRGAGSIWSQTLVSNIPGRNGDLVFAHFNGSTWAEPLVMADNGRIGIFSTTPRASLDINTTDAILLPVGSVGNRPAVPVDGMIRYNSQSGKFEGHQGGAWQDILTSAVAGGAAAPNRGIQFNSNGSFAAVSGFQYTSGGSFLTSGALTGMGDSSLPTGAGVRMFFDPSKAAFRAGSVSAAQWDNISIASYSTAMGQNTTASGQSSVALGSATTASGGQAIAMGYGTMASGANAVAVGWNTIASGSVSTALGRRTTASGSGSTAMGWETVASGSSSTAMGRGVAATAQNSGAIGFGSATGLLPSVDAENAFGLFFGDQSGVTMADPAARSTVGIFGGKLVIDPRVPAAQTWARATLDLGASTDAVLLPVGSNTNRPAGVNGMIRYNSQNGKFEGFQQGAWQDILTGAAGGAAGANTQIQYNSNGSLWASPSFTWNGTTSTLDVQGTARFGLENIQDGTLTVAGSVNVVPNAAGTSRMNVTNSSDDGYSALELHNSAVGGQNWQIMSGGVNQAGLGGAGITEGNLLFWNQTTDNIRMVIAKNSGFVGIGPSQPQAQLDVQGSNAILLPRGVTGNRPAGIDGMIRYNSQTNRFEGHQAGTWQDLVTIGTAPGAASPNRGIQFNSNGAFGASNDFQFTSGGSFLVRGVVSYVGDSSLPSGAGSRMFFDPTKAAFRAGSVGSTQWDNANIGDHSVGLGSGVSASGPSAIAMGVNAVASNYASMALGTNSQSSADYAIVIGDQSTASGQYSMALGRNVVSSGSHSMAIGLSNFATTPTVSGAGSLGIFMGAQTMAQQLTTANTMGLFGGQLVIDPRAPAQQLTARGVIDVGAATDAIVLPIGSNTNRPAGVNGMIRYNSQSNRFEGFQAGSWQDIITGMAASSIDSLTDAIANYTSANMYLGQGVGAVTTTGNENTAIGADSLLDVTEGAGNTAVGRSAMQRVTTGYSNTAVGNATLTYHTTSWENTALGSSAMAGGSGSSFNTAVGSLALSESGSGANTALGARAGAILATGSHNIFVGQRAADNITDGSNNIIIGSDVDTSSTTVSNELNIGNFLLGRMDAGLLRIAGTGALTLPIGSNGNRPAGVNGMIRYNSQSNRFEGFQAGAWQDIVTGAATSTFLSLTDTPSTYTGQGNKFVRVNNGATALEFTDEIVTSYTGMPAPTGMALNDLTDATVASPMVGQVLMYSGGQWVNGNISVGGNAAAPSRGIQFNSAGNFAADPTFVYTAAGRLGIGTASPAAELDVTGTGAIVLPRGTSAQQPVGVNGMLRYNSQSNKFEGFQNGSWQDILTGAATTSFLALTDTPSTYAGQANKFVRVNAGTTALEFTDQIVPSVSGQPAPTGTILDDLADVTIATPTAGQILTYSSGQWINAAAPVSGGTPAGLNSQLQFNSGGAFGAVSNLTWNVGTTSLGVTGSINVSNRINIAGQAGNAPVAANLDSLSDVTIAGPSAGQILTYSGGQWINAAATGGSATAAGVNTNIQFNSGGNMGAATTFVYSAAGNLGVGTTTPAARIHAYSTNAVGNTVLEGIRLTRENTGGNGASGIGNSIGFQTESGNGTMVETGRIESVLYDAANGSKDADMRFYTLGQNAAAGTTTATEAMRIDSNKVLYAGGISSANISTIQGWNWNELGFAMHQKEMTLIGEGSNYADIWLDYYGGAGSAALIFDRSRNTMGSPQDPQQDDRLGNIGFRTNAPGGRLYAASIEAFLDGSNGTNDAPGRLDFLTTPDGTATPIERMSIKNTGRIQIGTGTPRARLDVNGAIQIGNDGETCSAAADRGSIRFNGTEFEVCRDHAQGWGPLVNAPVDAVCDASHTFSSPGTFGYRVPANFGTLTIRMWGGGGGGGGGDSSFASPANGTAGTASTIISRGLSAGGGAGGVRSTGAVGAGGAGGVAAGGDTNTDGNAGASGVDSTNSGAGGNAPGTGGGLGGTAAAYGWGINGNSGNAPGGGGSGGTQSIGAAAEGGGGGSGAYVQKVLTSADIAPGAIISDIVIGGGGSGGSGGGNGGSGGNGRIVFDCVSGPPNMALNDLNDVTITSPTNGQTLVYNGSQWVNSAGGGGGSAASPNRGIQFNSGGSFAADSKLQYTSAGSLLITGTNTGISDPSLPTGAGVRMIFDPNKGGAFRAGSVAGNQWNSIGLSSVALGDDNEASGQSSVALGTANKASGLYAIALGRLNEAASNYSMALGWDGKASGIYSTTMGRGVRANQYYSFALGLGDYIGDGTSPLVAAQNAVGIFFQGQNGVVMSHPAAQNTMGVFGGKLVIDPRQPALQTSARATLDIGAATDAIILPYGGTSQQPAVPVNGMLRYNSQTDKFEGYQAGSWMNIIGGAGSAAGSNTQLQFNSGGSFGAVSNLTWTQGTTTLGVNGKVNFTPTAASAPVFPSTTTPPAGANTQIQFNNSGAFGASTNLTWNGTTFAVVGDVTYTGTITDVSDMRLKNNILPLNDRGSMLNKLDQIGTYSFTMKDDQNGRVEFGVMAQEINKVFPELVKVDENSAEKYMSVNYVGLIAPLIEASKELKSENENLKAQISTIEERMASLESDMNGVKAHTGYGISKAQMGLGMMLGMMLMGGMAGVAMIVVNRRRRQG